MHVMLRCLLWFYEESESTKKEETGEQQYDTATTTNKYYGMRINGKKYAGIVLSKHQGCVDAK